MALSGRALEIGARRGSHDHDDLEEMIIVLGEEPQSL